MAATLLEHPASAHLGERVIVVADLVESVRLMEIDEEGTVQRWQSFVARVEADCLQGCAGRLVKSVGDGLVLDFASPPAAVRCCFAIQELCDRLNAQRDDAPPLCLRLGAHVGPVFANRYDIYGRAVNLAARLTALAAPGQLVVSAELRDRIVDQLDANVEDLGLCYVKHLSKPVRAYVVDRPADEDAGRVSALEAPADLRPAIAVIPFADRDSEPGTWALGDALADEIIAALSRAPAITVVSRLSTAVFRARQLEIARIRSHLGVAYVVSGWFRGTAETVWVHAELCDVRDGRLVWDGGFEARVSDLFHGQDDMIPRIVGCLSQAVVAKELERVRSLPIPSLEEYSLFMGGVALLHRLSPADFFRAREVLQHVADRQPRAAAPLAMLAKWHILRLVQGWSSDPLEHGREAQACARRALRLEPDNAFSLAIDGLVSCHVDRDLSAAAEVCAAAVRSNPQEPYAWTVLSGLHSYRGEAQQAELAAARAIELSPLDPARFVFEAYAAMAKLIAGKYAEGAAQAAASLRRNAMHAPSHRLLVIALMLDGRGEEARHAAQALLRVEPALTVSRYLQRHPGRDEPHASQFGLALKEAGIPP
ncbi:MAG: hypothetical protein JO133_13795 [Burkholderiaceae bacterium]|nr:hypothetical protein [Burkholderiaceae bacterium]